MTFEKRCPATLSAQGLSYRVRSTKGPVTLLHDISFRIDQNDILALVGPNGAGKTTLIRLIAGLEYPSSGAIFIDGQAIHSLSFIERARRIAYVGQSEEPDGRLFVEHYVGLGRLPHDGFFAAGIKTDHAARALEALGIKELSARRMDSLSGGERQKAKIARALCQQPSLLVLDEPTNHLDPSARGELLGLVASMEIPVVVALHDLTLIDAFANKVAVISNGRLTAFGAPEAALSTEHVRRVFHVDLHRFDHPIESRKIPALDIALGDVDPSHFNSRPF